MGFLHRSISTGLIVVGLQPLFAAAADVQFQGPSSVVYFVGTQYEGGDAAVYFFNWDGGVNVSPLVTSGQLPAGLAFATLPLPLPNDESDVGIEGTPAVGSEGTYELTLSATVDGTEYSYPIKLVVEDQSGIPGTFTLTGGFTGNWYGGASQSGNGFSIEILPNSILLAEWMVFAPSGGQAWIVGTGPIVGNSATVSGYQVVGPGAVFPPFYDNTYVQTQLWGSLTFTFSDCNNGQVSWAPIAAGYKAGSMLLQRLTTPAGLTCP